MTRYLGTVLAGGESRRFGSPKAAAVVGGESLVRRSLDALRAVTDQVVVVSSRPVEGVDDVPVIPDRIEGAGPLGGLHAALLEAEERGCAGVLLLGCDLPLVSGALVSAVAGALGEAPAVAPRRASGGVEPLCAAYAVGVRGQVEGLLEEGDRSLHGLFRAVGGRELGPAELGHPPAHAFLNVNAPEDRDRAELLLRRVPAVVCVVGKKRSGKTTTAVGLMRELSRRGHHVMSAKHGHRFELDREGTDSWRHRHEGGAARVALTGPEGMALAGDWEEDGELDLETVVQRYLSDADVVVAEGYRRSRARRIEVFRGDRHDAPWYGVDPVADDLYLAILTDREGFEAHVPVLHADDPERFARVAELVEAQLMGDR